jgi:hypothetical protein
MGIDHLAHPDRFAAQIEIVGAGRGAGGDQIGAVELIGPDRGQHRPGLREHRIQRRRIACISGYQRRVGRRADGVADSREFIQAAPGHGPGEVTAAVTRRQILGHKLAGKTAGTVDNDVEFRRRLHDRFLMQPFHNRLWPVRIALGYFRA